MSFAKPGSALVLAATPSDRLNEAEYLRRERLQAYEAMRETWLGIPRVARATIRPQAHPLVILGLAAAAAGMAGACFLGRSTGVVRRASRSPLQLARAALENLTRSVWSFALSALLTRLFFGHDDSVLAPPPDDAAPPLGDLGG